MERHVSGLMEFQRDGPYRTKESELLLRNSASDNPSNPSRGSCCTTGPLVRSSKTENGQTQKVKKNIDGANESFWVPPLWVK